MKTITFLTRLYFPMKDIRIISVNRHNCSQSTYWNDDNPHWMRFSYSVSSEVKCMGILGNTIIGPFFLNKNVNAKRYLHLFSNKVLPAIQNVIDAAFNNIWFQQDGALPYFSINVRQFVNHTFSGKWISKKGTIKWSLIDLLILIH